MIKLSRSSFVNEISITNKETSFKKLPIFRSLLSLGGLPTFLGFLPKEIVIQAMTTNSITPIATTILIISLATLY
jgi:NADH:ubiquinone oxidoreductase subunit 2 (subunit N)